MTIQDILKAAGLTDEQIVAIAESMKKNKIFTSSEENLDIRYSKLKSDHDSLTKQYGEAEALIEEMKKASKGNEDLQSKVAEYEAKIGELKEELKEEKLSSAIKVGLLSEKAMDIDYLAFKLKEDGELILDDNDQVKGWSEKIEALKKKFPNQFESPNQKKIEPNSLNKGQSDEAPTKEAILKMPYSQRAELYQKDPEAFSQIMKS
ncbi:MAG: phage scaffolding protein [Bullifex sp.]